MAAVAFSDAFTAGRKRRSAAARTPAPRRSSSSQPSRSSAAVETTALNTKNRRSAAGSAARERGGGEVTASGQPRLAQARQPARQRPQASRMRSVSPGTRAAAAHRASAGREQVSAAAPAAPGTIRMSKLRRVEPLVHLVPLQRCRHRRTLDRADGVGGDHRLQPPVLERVQVEAPAPAASASAPSWPDPGTARRARR